MRSVPLSYFKGVRNPLFSCSIRYFSIAASMESKSANRTDETPFMILGIETSCDDSAVAILDMDGTVIANKISSQSDLHKRYGGVVPELASRRHLTTLPLLLRFVFDRYRIDSGDLKAIAVTYAPGLIGSLLVGVNYAKSLAWVYDCPLIPVDHLEGHLLSPFLDNAELRFPYLGLIASGGHTHLIAAYDFCNYRLLGKTVDDAAGEAFDKVAKMLGFQYPGGPIVDRISERFPTPATEFPIPLKGRNTLNFSFSGLKTAVRNEALKQGVYSVKRKLIGLEQFDELPESEHKRRVGDIVASFQRVVCKIFEERIEKALQKTDLHNFAITGGVAANSGLRRSLQKLAERRGGRFFCPQPVNCTDNAAMIAYTGLKYYKRGEVAKDADLNLNASSVSPLGRLEATV